MARMAKATNGSASAKKKPPDRVGLRRKLVEKEILEKAAELFAERGYAGASLQDVAETLGMSRPALYHYVSSKEEILGRLVERLSRHDAAKLDAIRRRRSATAPEKLREMALALATNASSNRNGTRILAGNRHHLPPEIAEADRIAARSVVRSLCVVIEQGMDDGVFRPLDAHTAAMAIVGLCLWTAWWFDPDKHGAPEGIAEQVADQALAGMVAGDSGLDRGDPAQLLRALREDIGQLERILER